MTSIYNSTVNPKEPDDPKEDPDYLQSLAEDATSSSGLA